MESELSKPDIKALLSKWEDASKTARPEPSDEEKKEAERRVRESERVNWLNQFYADTSRHDLPMSADGAKLSLLVGGDEDKDSIELIKAWDPMDEFGFLIIGPAGCGKSFALQAIAKKVIFDHNDFSTNRRKLIWFPVSNGLDRLRREMSEGTDAYKKSVLSADYLFIDDLGAENLTDWAREQIYQIFEHRINYALTTFISSNCMIDELKDRYHERFVSRLKEACVFLQLKGRDRRSDRMKQNANLLRDRIRNKGGSHDDSSRVSNPEVGRTT